MERVPDTLSSPILAPAASETPGMPGVQRVVDQQGNRMANHEPFTRNPRGLNLTSIERRVL